MLASGGSLRFHRRLASVALLICAIAAPARAAEPPASAERAVLAGEDKAQGADVPALSEPPSLGDLVGKPIVRIDVDAEGGRWRLAPPITSVELGEPLSLEVARRAMREVLASGKFARAAVEAVAVPGGAALRIAVLPRRRIAAVQLTGGTLDRQHTLDAAGLSEEGEVTGPMLPDIAARIRGYYVEHGYPAAAVTVDTADTDDPARVVLSIEIAPGAPRTVTRRIFVIDPIADRELGPLKRRYRFGAGARIDEPSFTEADHDMVDVLRQAGFQRAEVAHRVQHEGPNSFLYVYLKPGPRIVPTFDGNRAFDDDALTDALGLGTATEAKPGELVDRLRSFYVQRGFLDVEVAATERGGAADPVHYLAFTLREHEQVRVAKRVFPCLTGDLSADDVGKEIESFLEEDLPGAKAFSLPDPRVVSDLFGPTQGAGGRGRPVELNPAMTYAPETYDRALKHLRELYYSKGYLNAVVGPASVVRATCSRRSPAGACLPEPVTQRAVARCRTDALGLPLPEPPVPDELLCRPDPARHVACAPEVTLRIPIQLGPQTVLYDLDFEGNRGFCQQSEALSERDRAFCAKDSPFSAEWLSRVADLSVGQPISNLALDAARLRILDAYRDLGYAYAEVRTVLEPSPDRTRARARFIISERDRVYVTGFVIKGAIRTDEALIMRRVLLKEGTPFRQSQARLSEERIATLGAFSSVSISLEDPQVPQKNKRVIVSVVEQLPQYLDPRIGFSTGEGIRFAFEYGHRNIAGLAIGLTLRVQLSYLLDFIILDDTVRRNYKNLSVGDRLERRDTVSITLPEIGLGSLIGLSIDGVDVRDNQRDFGLTRQAFIPAVTYRPRRSITAQLATSVELNDVNIFNRTAEDDAKDALDSAIRKGVPCHTIALAQCVPYGRTVALAQRLNVSWDGRDNPFNATKGFLISAGAEHVDAFPENDSTVINSHFIRFTGRVAGYIRLHQKTGMSLALGMSAGYNFQLTRDSLTYPDRLFYLGGVDTLRAFLADSVVPEDVAQRILRGEKNSLGQPFTAQSIAVRGGDVALNPRAELRIPLNDLFQLGLFLDTGNLWVNPSSIDLLALRYAGGAGLRLTTPIGPLALDYGINLNRRAWEDFGAFHFSIGLF